MSNPVKSFFRKTISYILSYIIALQPVFAASTGVPSTNGITPVVGSDINFKESNGIPVMNINAPTIAGVSHNKFNDFNVNEPGLIVNNLNMQNYNPNYKSSLSDEHVAFNYNLGTGDAARVILNEVVSNNISSLKGQTEIYGQRADYIVANPNGITCAGCGFINTGRLSLITGSSNISNGNIDGFNISSVGTLRIDGVGVENFGLYAPTHAELVSNSIRIAGNIHIDGNLSLYSGNVRFDYKNKTITSDDITRPVSVAIDSIAVGGIKANNIKIIATQLGFGIRTSGNLVADMGNVEITGDGDIVTKNIAAKNDINLESISNNIKTGDGSQSDVYAQNNINIKTAKDYTNDFDSKIVAQNSIDIKTGKKLKNIGKINSANQLNLLAMDLNNYGQFLSGQNMYLSVDSDLINYRGAGILSGQSINMKIGRDLVNYKAEIYAQGNINISGREDINIDPSGLIITSANMSTMASLYDNPYIDSEVINGVTPPVLEPLPPDEEPAKLDVKFRLSDNTIITLPFDVFNENAEAGTSYTTSDGYVFIIGTETITMVNNPEYDNC
ncbi:MAG: filamentous hemagglutinin N-terminal domain-containing protein, partial [Bacteroidales bacterium]|nr:filamentous hemagglutinin N-terminal domain-containing protein [Bacteroidales bacterium]